MKTLSTVLFAAVALLSPSVTRAENASVALQSQSSRIVFGERLSIQMKSAPKGVDDATRSLDTPQMPASEMRPRKVRVIYPLPVNAEFTAQP